MSLLSTPIDGVDGRLKVTGGARYAAENNPPGLLHAVIVQSTIPSGRIAGIDSVAATRAPGVVLLMSHLNAPKLEVKDDDDFAPGFPLLQDDRVLFNGQHIAVVVAETLEQARYAAGLVKIRYDETPATILMPDDPSDIAKPKRFRDGEVPADARRGDADKAFEQAAVKLDETYITPIEHHNAMEPHATVALWQDGKLVVYNATQSITKNQQALARFLRLSNDQIRVINPYVGGGFGSKGNTWPHITLAAMAAQMVRRPVKLVLERRQMFTSNGYRPKTVQHLKLGADANGRLVAIKHDTISQNARYNEFDEPSGLATEMLYSCPNVAVTHRLSVVSQGLPTFMRAPGESTGVYALESAMDEISYKLGIDPIELRLRNYAERDEQQDKPFSSKSLRQCYQQGAASFEWSRRKPGPGSMRDGRYLVGLGMASATYPVNRMPSNASVSINRNGLATVKCGSQDIGTGTYTIMTQVAAEALDVPLDHVHAELGDSAMPAAPTSGGSMTVASITPAIQAACTDLRKKAIAAAIADPASPLHNALAEDVAVHQGWMSVGGHPDRGETYGSLAARSGKDLTGEASATPGDAKKKFSMHSFGAQFAEVRVDPDLGEVRVVRYAGAFAAGRILNTKTARSQFLGGIVYGMGMALLEQSEIDPRSGRITNANIAEYLVPVNLDVPKLDIVMVEEHEEAVGPLGAKGIGELPMVGVAAAIANAVYHATGKRIRDLPIRSAKLLV